MNFQELCAKHNITTDICSGVGDGWCGLLDELITKLIELGWDKKVLQVKEKFGALRFYIGAETDEMRMLVNKYESMSMDVCERCGAPANTGHTSTGWCKTFCEPCMTADNKRRAEEEERWLATRKATKK